MIGCKFVPGDVLWQRRYILLKATQDAVVILQPIKEKNKTDIYIDNTTESEQMSHCFALCGLTMLPVITACH